MKKEKPLFSFDFFLKFGTAGTRLVKCKCIYFCTNMRIWIDLGKKYGKFVVD